MSLSRTRVLAMAASSSGLRRRRWVVGLVAGMVVAASLGVTGLVGTGAASPGAARGAGGPIRVLFPRAGAVIVAGTAGGAHRLRLAATVSITRRVRGLGLRLNGHPIRIPARSGRLRVRLDAADGLVLGENLLWVTVGGRDGHPVVPFVVGYRDTRALAVHLRLGAGALSAATLSLRVPMNGIESISVTLNGARVPVRPDGGATGRIALDLPELGPVHWGANRLAVRLIMFDGRIDDWTRTFRLDPRRDVAIAQVVGPAVVGHTVTLSASRSLIVRGASGPRGYHWVLLHRPRLSHARLGRPHGARITLRLDVPGDYQVALLVGRVSRPAGHEASVADSGSGSYDVANVAARYAEPLVPLNTIAHQGSVEGVQVGSDFYPNPGGTLQVVVLNRSTLELLDNRAYSPCCYSNAFNYLKTLPTTDLVIAAFPSGPYYTSLIDANRVLGVIGGSTPGKWTLSTPHCWSGATDQCGNNLPVNTTPPASWQLYNSSYVDTPMSVIGVPGMQVGQAWRETAWQNGGNGAIVGYLTQGNTGGQSAGLSDYTVINGGADAYEAVNTCAPPNCDVQIGYPADPIADLPADAKFATYPSPGPNGMQVLELDRTTLKPLLNTIVTTQAQLLSALSWVKVGQGVAHVVGSIDDQRLVIIRSVGDGQVGALSGGGPASQDPLWQYIDELGGTPDLLYEAMAHGKRYALVGAATDLPWRNTSALESSTAIPGSPPSNPSASGGASLQTGQISGVLQRDPTGLYTPVAGDPVGTTNSELDRILYQPAQPWPYADDTQDLQYIANKLGLYDWPDIRSAYYDNPSAPWSILRQELTVSTDPNYVPCPPQDECGPDSTFEHLRTELANEFEWVLSVRNFATNLLKPYQQDAGYIPTDVTNVTTTVNASKPVPPAANIKFPWLKTVSDVLHIASGLAAAAGSPRISGGFGALAAAGDLATNLMATQTQPNGAPAPADTLSIQANNLTNQLLDQVQAYEFWVSNTMERVVLRDYGKLMEVGKAVLGEQAWQLDQNISLTVTALRGETRASAYSALIPVVWPGYNLKPDDLYGQPGYSNDTANFTCDSNQDSGTKNIHHIPFQNATQANQLWWVPAGEGIPLLGALTTQQPNGSVIDQAWVFAQLNGNATPVHMTAPWNATLPSPDLTHYIYGADSTNPDYGAYQVAPVWWRNTYNPPSYTQCYRVASGNSSFNYNSTAYPPPNIPAPPP